MSEVVIFFSKLVTMPVLPALFFFMLLQSSQVTSSSRLKGQVKLRVKSEAYVTLWKQDTLQIAGSGLPDCSHACGACRPCRLAMVSFICATLEEAESCPMAYRCMCRERAFPIP